MPVAPKDTDLKWLLIEDFTPGIVSNANLASILTGFYKGPVPANRPGIAQGGFGGVLQTFGCIGLPGGGLAPLPGVVTPAWNSGTAPVAPHHAIATGAGALNLISGLFITTPMQFFGSVGAGYPLTNGEELIVGQSQIATGGVGTGNASSWVDSLQINGSTATWNNILTPTAATARLPMATMTGAITRANSSPSLIGNATWILQLWFTGASSPSFPQAGTAYLFNYPDPTSLGSFTPRQFATPGASVTFCNTFAHQNRMVFLQYSPTEWSVSSEFVGGNEEFFYTDPPNGLALVSSGSVFVQEDPSGYGAWGSQSAAELFLVKNNGGGAVISGDLNSPTVTRLPGVTPAYGLMSRGASTPIGFVYASANNGLWAWNGGNVTQKISTQLEDNFFARGNGTIPAILTGPTVDICRWRDYILVTGDWLYDTITGSWWKLPPGFASTGHMWFAASSDGTTLYAAQGVPTSTYFMDVYSALSPTSTYQWASYPMRLSTDSKNRSYVVREVVVRAQGQGTVQVNVYDDSNGLSTASPSNTVSFGETAKPTMGRIVIGASGGGPLVAEDVQIELIVNATVPGRAAPVVYSVAVGYVEETMSNST